MVEEVHELEVAPFIPFEIERSPDAEPGIVPNTEDQKGYSDHTYCGKVTEITEEWPCWVILNIGIGTVSIQFYEDTPDHVDYQNIIGQLNSGENICVKVSRTDLKAVK